VRRAPLLFAILTVAACAWMLSRGAPIPRSSESSALSDFGQSNVQGTPLDAKNLLSPIDVSTRTPVELSTRSSTAQPSGQEQARDLVGRLTVVEFDGKERADVAGRLLMHCWLGGTELTVGVNVVDGVWRKTADFMNGVEAIGFQGVEIDGRRGEVLEPSERLEPPYPAEVRVRASLPQQATLRVVDADNGQELQGVTVVRANRPNDGDRHPGTNFEDRVVFRNRSSPFAIDASKFQRIGGEPVRLLVGAPNHAWDLVEVDVGAGGERLVELSGGADLAIQVRGVASDSGTYLRLLTEINQEQWVQLPLVNDGMIELGGLAPGNYRVLAGIGFYADSSLFLGEAEVVMRSGARTRCDLHLAAAPQPELVAAAGVIYVPEAWEVDQVWIWIHRLDPWIGDHLLRRMPFVRTEAGPSDRTGFDAFRWHCEDMPVGRYELGVTDPCHWIEFELPSGGRDDLEVRVPPPVDLLVHVVDAETGRMEPIEDLTWQVTPSEGRSIGQPKAAQRLAPGEFLIRAPACEVHFPAYFLDPYIPDPDRVDLTTTREHTLRVRRACGFDLMLLDGVAPVALPVAWKPEVFSAAIGGIVLLQQPVAVRRSFLAWRVVVSEPGTYALEMPSIPGYEPIPKQTIEVSAGQFPEHVVKLVRKH
jgi:hypothetical protein